MIRFITEFEFPFAALRTPLPLTGASWRGEAVTERGAHKKT